MRLSRSDHRRPMTRRCTRVLAALRRPKVRRAPAHSGRGAPALARTGRDGTGPVLALKACAELQRGLNMKSPIL